MTILITGGKGMIGSRLSDLLYKKGHDVLILSRNPKKTGRYKEYKWSVEDHYIDDEAIKRADVIIHLAGANVGEKKWTPSRKKELYSSRIDTANLLFEACERLGNFPKAFISASGSTIYGVNSGQEVQFEDQKRLGDDFLANLTKDWEKAAKRFEDKKVRVAIFRTAVVLTMEGGALPRYVFPAKFGLAAPLGSGKQMVSWIHIQDIARLYLFALENEISGAYNASSTETVSNKEFMKRVSKILSRPFFVPNVPAFALKLVFGELAEVVLGGNNLSNEKILQEGFVFEYPDLNSALENLLT